MFPELPLQDRKTSSAVALSGTAIEREHLATPLGMSPDRPPQGRPSLTYTAVNDGD